MLKMCKNCDRALKQNDIIIATVVAQYVELASKIAYSVTRPSECLEIVHKNCQNPQGDHDGD